MSADRDRTCDLIIERAHLAANPNRVPFKAGDQFLIDGKLWTIDHEGDHTKSDGSWYCLNAPGEEDVEIKSHAELDVLPKAPPLPSPRVLLEKQCAELFHLLFEEVRELSLDLAVVVFDHAGSSNSNLAFKSSLPSAVLASSFRNLVSDWRAARTRYSVPGLTHARLASWGITARNLLPPGIGYALLVGSNATRAAYVSSGERLAMMQFIENELLPKWEAQAQGN